MKPVPPFKPFGGPQAQVSREEARCVILPLCYENHPSYGLGADTGPWHLLDASVNMEHFDEETGLEWHKARFHTMEPPELPVPQDQAVEEIRRLAADILGAGVRMLALGGDHSISIGCIAAAASVHPGLGVLQIDAHTDLRDEYNGSRYNHACVMRRVVDDLGLPVVQAGIRSLSAGEASLISERGYRPFYAHEVAGADPEWMDRAIAALPDKVYLTVDLDGLDPSEMPGTGTPEPGGFRYREVVELIRRLARSREVVAADVCELVAFPGSQVSEYTAARIAQKILHLCWG